MGPGSLYTAGEIAFSVNGQNATIKPGNVFAVYIKNITPSRQHDGTYAIQFIFRTGSDLQTGLHPNEATLVCKYYPQDS